MERLAFDCEYKGDGAAGAGAIEGHASVFGVMDRGGDIMLPGAFKATLADWRKKKSPVPMLWQHNSDEPIGVWTDLVEDEKGLKAIGELVLDVPLAVSARALLLKGALKGLSIGYQTKESEIDRTTGVRRLKRVDLWEISLVTFPMLPEAQVTNVKGFDPNLMEKALRDEAGLSNREAKAAVSVFRKHVLRDGGQTEPPPRDGTRDVLMALRKANAALST